MLGVKEILGEKVEEQNQDYINRLKENFKSDKITWVLGAGISVPAGLPQWDELVMNMWTLLSEVEKKGRGTERADVFQKECIAYLKILERKDEYKEKYLKKFYDAMHGKSNRFLTDVNVLESAEYLWNNIKSQSIKVNGNKNADERTLKKLIREALLISIKPDKIGEPFQKEALRKELENESIGEIAKLLKARKRGNIITYNFDDLLEFCLEEVAGTDKDEVWIGCDNDHEPGKEQIRIYHPHGKIQLFSEWNPAESEHVILTESGYYSMESKVYNWANSIQAKALVENSCVFIGFSGTDYNFRRIIKNCDEQQADNPPRHYIFMGLDTLVSKFWGEVMEDGHKALTELLSDKERERRKRILSEEQKNSPEWKSLQDTIKREKEDVLKKACEKNNYIFERVQMLNYCSAQTRYWGKYGIAPIWVPFADMPGKIREIAGKLLPER